MCLSQSCNKVNPSGTHSRDMCHNRTFGSLFPLGYWLPSGGNLTPREMQVLLLIARGHCNRDIATHLVIAQGTARWHVANILRKLHVHSRQAAAGWCLDRTLQCAQQTAGLRTGLGTSRCLCVNKHNRLSPQFAYPDNFPDWIN